MGLLAGITRKKIIEFCQKNKILCQEKIILARDVASYQGAFITSTLRGIVWVKSIDKHLFEEMAKDWIYKNLVC